jgi:hypothetical protein
MNDLWLAVLSSRGRRRRPSLRVGLPWVLSFLAWTAMARLAVDGRAFNDGWLYWLTSGGLVVPAAVVLASLPTGAWPSPRSALACVAASLVGTVFSVFMLRASREPATFAVLGGFVVGLAATGSYVVATSMGETARGDADDP